MSQETLVTLIVNGLVVGSIYSMVAIGFVIIYKTTRVLNFAQGELLAVGAYVCLSLTISLQLPFYLSFVLTMVVALALGFAIERVVLRPVLGEPVISIIMITFGLALLLRALIGGIWGVNVLVFPPLVGAGFVRVLGVPVSYEYLFGFSFSLLAMAGLGMMFTRTRIGLAMRATASNRTAAMTMGISIRRVFAVSWAISCAVSATGGILIGLIAGVNIMLAHFGLKVFPTVILGGLDSIVGTAIAGLAIGLVENLADGAVKAWLDIDGTKEVAAFVLLVVVLMIRPYGLMGQHEIERI